MLRRFVRLYFRLRYFPRQVFERLNAIADGVTRLHDFEGELIGRMAARHEQELTRLHEEVTSFCDDAIHAMGTMSASIAELHARVTAMQTVLHRLDAGAVDVRNQIAASQVSRDLEWEGSGQDASSARGARPDLP